MQITREDDPSMLLTVDTGKHAALCAAKHIPIDTPVDVLLDMLLDDLSWLEIYRRAQGWLEKRILEKRMESHDKKAKA